MDELARIILTIFYFILKNAKANTKTNIFGLTTDFAEWLLKCVLIAALNCRMLLNCCHAQLTTIRKVYLGQKLVVAVNFCWRLAFSCGLLSHSWIHQNEKQLIKKRVQFPLLFSLSVFSFILLVISVCRQYAEYSRSHEALQLRPDATTKTNLFIETNRTERKKQKNHSSSWTLTPIAGKFWCGMENDILSASIASHLPDSILEAVFSYLELRDLRNCSLVCKNWYRYLNDENNDVWRMHCIRKLTEEAIKSDLLSSVPTYKSKLRAFFHAWNPMDCSRNVYIKPSGFTLHRYESAIMSMVLTDLLISRICKFIEILWHKVRMAREVKLDFGMDDTPGKWCGKVRWVQLPWSAYQHEMLHFNVTVTWHCLAPTKIVGVGIWSIIIYYTMAMRLAAIHCWTMPQNIKLANEYEWF